MPKSKQRRRNSREEKKEQAKEEQQGQRRSRGSKGTEVQKCKRTFQKLHDFKMKSTWAGAAGRRSSRGTSDGGFLESKELSVTLARGGVPCMEFLL